MDRRQKLVSLFILLVCVTKLVEVGFRIEWYPLTHTGLFQDYEPADKIPWTYTLEAYRGRWRTLRPWHLQIGPGAFRSKLGSDLDQIPERCGAMIDALNRLRRPKMKIERARILAHGHARPGSGLADQELEIECELDENLRELS